MIKHIVPLKGPSRSRAACLDPSGGPAFTSKRPRPLMGPSLQGQCRAKGPKGKNKKQLRGHAYVAGASASPGAATREKLRRHGCERPRSLCHGICQDKNLTRSTRGTFTTAFAKTKTLRGAPAEPSPRGSGRNKRQFRVSF